MSEAQRRAQSKWRENHREQYNASQLELANRYYHENKGKVLEYKRKKYLFDKEAKILRNILIDEN